MKIITTKKQIDHIETEHAYCDTCNVELNISDLIHPTKPPIYIYYCPKCHKKDTSRTEYPKTTRVYKEGRE